MSVKSISRFVIVCAIAVSMYFFTVPTIAVWLGVAMLSTFKPVPAPTEVPSSYQAVKSAFDDIFEDVDHLPKAAPAAAPQAEVHSLEAPATLTYRELQLALKTKYTASQRKKLGIKLSANKAQLEEWLNS